MTGDIPFARSEYLLRLYRFLRSRGSGRLLPAVASELVKRGIL